MSNVILSKDDDHNHTQMSVSFYWASLQWFYHRHRHRKYTDLLLLNSVLFLSGLWAKRKKTNKEVLNKLGLQSTKLMTVVRQRIVRFYGHVRRHDSIQRIITEGMVNGKRGSRKEEMRMAGKRLPISRNEHKQMRRNCYQQGRMEDHSIQRRVRQGTAVR